MPVKHDGRTVYFCVDLEASGPVPGIYNMVSIGAVEVRYDGEKHVRGAEYYAEIAPDFDGFDDGAMAIHGLTLEHLREHGKPGKEVMAELTEWVKSRLKKKEKALFVGHNAPFDWMFTAWYLAWAGIPNVFGYNALDTKALMMGRHQLAWRKCNKSVLLDIYPQLEALPPEMVHNALADAQFQADILIALLDD